LDNIYDDKSGKRRVTGPVEYAIDGKDETAWGTEADPDRSNQPRKAVFTAEKPISFPLFPGGSAPGHRAGETGTILTFLLTQNHGGWNSDDNQNHNLGRFRLSITTQPGAVADPLPAGVRQILSIPAERRSPAQTATVFSYWRMTVTEWKEANDKMEALWRQHPQGSSQLVLQAQGKSRETHILKRGDFLKPGKS